ncbi:MAG: DUF1329 domain-containing protein [Rhodocyclales bacterium]|nr:DUF1329 domain-containing protein [Rhodocyclales bacterium]
MTNRNRLIATLACAFLQAPLANAAVTPEEAAKLKSILTPMGGEKAGNKDGTIPAWDGGYTKVPAGWKQGDLRPDPFANEKPTLQITAKNADQYADKLSDGVKALLKKYPNLRVDVYPTHRTAAAPHWIYENTFKNATRTKLKDGGKSLEGASGGVPFPIPKNAQEVMWNHLLAWKGKAAEYGARAFVVQPDGKAVLSTQYKQDRQWPYFNDNDKGTDVSGGAYQMLRQLQVAPPFKAGESLLVRESFNIGREAWQYLVGQRRVRRAPNVAFDSPDTVSSGQGYFDEAWCFNGSLEKYDWKLIGKQEMFVPYNENRLYAFKDADLISTGYVNQDALRWELHRVWVVEATLAAGKRHVVQKRRFYIDEDSWHALLADGWDAQGQLWRMQAAIPFVAADGPGVFVASFTNSNLLTGVWVLSGTWTELDPKYKLVEPKLDSYYTPDALAGQGVR